MRRAKVFWTGRSQAVRLPLEYRFDADEVQIRREGASVILEPVAKRPWPPGWFSSFGPLGEDFRPPGPLPTSAARNSIIRNM